MWVAKSQVPGRARLPSRVNISRKLEWITELGCQPRGFAGGHRQPGSILNTASNTLPWSIVTEQQHSGEFPVSFLLVFLLYPTLSLTGNQCSEFTCISLWTYFRYKQIINTRSLCFWSCNLPHYPWLRNNNWDLQGANRTGPEHRGRVRHTAGEYPPRGGTQATPSVRRARTRLLRSLSV